MHSKREDWNRRVTQEGSGFLQSYEWGEFQEALGRKIFRIEKGGEIALLVKYNLALSASYLYCPRKVFRSVQEIKGLAEVARKFGTSERAAFLRIEPESFEGFNREELSAAGFREAESLQPKESLLIDLSKSEDDLLKDMEHDTRYAIRSAEKRGVKIYKSGELAEGQAFREFWRLMEETSKRQGISIYPKKYYEEMAKLNFDLKSDIYLAKLEDGFIAAALVLFFGGTATYIYACSAAGYGKYNAPSLIIWEIIREAKKRGSQVFDFWGISTDKKKWEGLTAFKRSFGGKPVAYGGTWDLPLSRMRYFIYKLIKRIR